MSVIGFILFGLVVDIVSKLIIPDRDPSGFIITILLGIAGALVSGFLGRSLKMYDENEPAGFVITVIGSIILLAIYRMVAGRRT